MKKQRFKSGLTYPAYVKKCERMGEDPLDILEWEMTQEMMSFSEIGRRLGIATQSVVQIYEMAMRKLKKIMFKDKDRFMLDVERGVDDEIFGV